MKTIQFGSKTLQIPTQISELNKIQLMRFVELQNAGLTIVQFNVLMMLNILDVQNRPFLKWYFLKNEYLIPFLDRITLGYFTWKVKTILPEDLYLLCSSFSEFQQEKFPLETPFQRFLLGWSGLVYAPEKLLSNLTYRQFRKCEELFFKYLDKKRGSEIDLNYLIAWLYLPNNMTIEYNLGSHAVDRRAKDIGKFSLGKRLSILNFYLSNREQVVKFYPYLYPQKRKGSFPSKPQTYQQIKADFEKSVRVLSPNITMDEATDLQNIHDALSHLNDKAEEIIKLKEMYEEQAKRR